VEYEAKSVLGPVEQVAKDGAKRPAESVSLTSPEGQTIFILTPSVGFSDHQYGPASDVSGKGYFWYSLYIA